MTTSSGDEIVIQVLKRRLKNLGDLLDGQVIYIRSAMQSGLDDAVRAEIDKIAPDEKSGARLIVVLETMGGAIEVVERLNHVFRHNFELVDFIIPNYAYSAGTVLALSGDEIYMDYYSVLGPIDPQVQARDGRWVPGLGILQKYHQLIEKSREGALTQAELQFLLNHFDPGLLFRLEQAKAHSADLIEQWLVQYKFKNWEERESTKIPVTPEYKIERAKQIADRLGDPSVWNSHGRGIPMSVLNSDFVNIKIIDFGQQSDLNKAIKEYYELVTDFTGQRTASVVVQTRVGFVLF